MSTLQNMSTSDLLSTYDSILMTLHYSPHENGTNDCEVLQKPIEWLKSAGL